MNSQRMSLGREGGRLDYCVFFFDVVGCVIDPITLVCDMISISNENKK